MAKTMSKNVLAVSVIFIYLTQYYYVTSGMYHKTFYNFNIVLYYVSMCGAIVALILSVTTKISIFHGVVSNNIFRITMLGPVLHFVL